MTSIVLLLTGKHPPIGQEAFSKVERSIGVRSLLLTWDWSAILGQVTSIYFTASKEEEFECFCLPACHLEHPNGFSGRIVIGWLLRAARGCEARLRPVWLWLVGLGIVLWTISELCVAYKSCCNSSFASSMYLTVLGYDNNVSRVRIVEVLSFLLPHFLLQHFIGNSHFILKKYFLIKSIIEACTLQWNVLILKDLQ